MYNKENNARFSITPLSNSESKKSIKGEFMMDPNNGHVYINKNGVPISKTVELEQRINKIEQKLYASNTGISLYGKDILIFFPEIKKLFNVIEVSGQHIRLSKKPDGPSLGTVTIDTDLCPMYFDPSCNYYMACMNHSNGAGVTSLKAYANNKPLFSRMSDAVGSVSENNAWVLTTSKAFSSENYALTNPLTFKLSFKITLNIPAGKDLVIASYTIQKLPIMIDDGSLNCDSLYVDKYNKTSLGRDSHLSFDVNPVNPIEVIIPKGKLSSGEYSLIVTTDPSTNNHDGEITVNPGYSNKSHAANLGSYTLKGGCKTIALSIVVDERVDGKITLFKKAGNNKYPIVKAISINRREVAQFSDNN